MDYKLQTNIKLNLAEVNANNWIFTGFTSIDRNYQKTSNYDSGLLENKKAIRLSLYVIKHLDFGKLNEVSFSKEQ